jgi:transcriptional regulator with XRE-family HTH domain
LWGKALAAQKNNSALSRYRRDLGMSQKELARASGVSHSYIGQMECFNKPITLPIAKKLARVLEIDATTLYRKTIDVERGGSYIHKDLLHLCIVVSLRCGFGQDFLNAVFRGKRGKLDLEKTTEFADFISELVPTAEEFLDQKIITLDKYEPLLLFARKLLSLTKD